MIGAKTATGSRSAGEGTELDEQLISPGQLNRIPGQVRRAPVPRRGCSDPAHIRSARLPVVSPIGSRLETDGSVPRSLEDKPGDGSAHGVARNQLHTKGMAIAAIQRSAS